jgi:hypothetical protein
MSPIPIACPRQPFEAGETLQAFRLPETVVEMPITGN